MSLKKLGKLLFNCLFIPIHRKANTRQSLCIISYMLGTKGFLSMAGIRNFFVEFKLFQLLVEEGGNFFSLRIFERGKHFMKSIFMGKNAALWLMKNIEHKVVGINPKQFFTLKEGDTAYTLQRGSNSFGQFLLVSELKVGRHRRSVIIPGGKAKMVGRSLGLN